jgi:hypothetical protein
MSELDEAMSALAAAMAGFLVQMKIARDAMDTGPDRDRISEQIGQCEAQLAEMRSGATEH